MPASAVLYFRLRALLRPFGLLLGAIIAVAGCGEQPRHGEPSATGSTASRPGGAGPGIGIGFAYGDSTAPVTVYEFSDFGCRYCAEFAAQTLPALEREFIAPGRVRWMFVPVASGAYPHGEAAARAAFCGASQERFWEMHHVLYERQRAWTSRRDPDPLLLAYAEEIGLDGARFEACYHGEEVRSRLAETGRTALLFGVRAYPSFFVGGRLIEGALATDAFRGVLTRALSAVAQAPGGTPQPGLRDGAGGNDS